MKYRSREIIEAEQFDPAKGHPRVLIATAVGVGRTAPIYLFERDRSYFVFGDTYKRIEPGDYIVTSVVPDNSMPKGSRHAVTVMRACLSVMSKAEFEQQYEGIGG